MRRGLNAVYAMHSSVGLASSLLAIFVPAYLISRHYAATDVFSYFLLYAIAVLIFFYIAANIARSVGLKAIALASFLLSLLYFYFLYRLAGNESQLMTLAIVQGASQGLYWFALHSFFIHGAERKTLGTSVGRLYGLPQVAGLFGPLVGGIIATCFGFPVLIVVSGICFLLSPIPLFLIPKITVNGTFSFATFSKLFHRFPRYSIIEFFENMRQEVESIVLPLFIYLTFRTALSVGIIGTLAGAGSILFTLFVGRSTDRMNPKIFMRTGAILMAAIWIGRYLSPPLQILFYALSLLASFFASLIEVPFARFVYATAAEASPSEFIVYREFPITLARICVYTVAIAISNVSALFVVAAIASLMILLF